MKNFFNKKRIIVAAVAGVLLVLNIIMACLPSFGTYKAEIQGLGESAEITLTFKGNKCVMEMTMGGESEKNEAEVKYNAKKHQWEVDGVAFAKRKSVSEIEVEGMEGSFKSALAVIMQWVFIVGYVACIGVFFGKKKQKKNQEE